MRESSLTLIFEDVDAKAAAMASQNSKKGIKDEKDISSESIIQRGAGQALTELANKFGSQLFDKVPKLWECLTSFKDFVDVSNDISVEKGQEIVDSFTVLRMVTESVDRSLHEKLIHLTPLVTQAVKSKYAVIRYASSKSLATLCKFITSQSMLRIIEDIVPLIGDSSNIYNRQGAIESIQHIVNALDIDILPYVLFLIVPILGRVSDADDNVRRLATSTFATLVKLVPLEVSLIHISMEYY